MPFFSGLNLRRKKTKTITMKKILTLLLFCFAYILSAQTFVPTTTVMPWGATWKWKNNSTDLGTAWYASGYNDAAFGSGAAPLGYGAVDAGYFGLVIPAQAVVTSIGSSGAAGGTNTATFYFRSTFTLSTSSYSVVMFKLRVDDGCAIYINGQLITTTMTKYATASTTNSTVSTTTVALPFQMTAPWTYTSMTNAQSTDGQDLFTFTLSVTNPILVNGANTIAVEAHNRSNDSSDILWGMQVEGGNNGTAPPVVPTIVKGPYLQVGTQNSMIVKWESNVSSDSKVMFGTSPASLTTVVTNTANVISHLVQLSGLTPYTKYYYSIGTTTATMQGDSANYFLTSPIPGTPGKYRFWVIGDCGNASTNQINCKNQYKAFNGNNNVTNGWLTLGDNAYSNGSDANFNQEFFGIYQNDVMKNIPLWPVPGNHDYNNGASTATTNPYFGFFSTPTNGEAGGVPSGNPAYYSYDYGNIHFIALDSYGTTGASLKLYDTTGAQVTWLKQDLAANTKKWTIAYWHHPPYTMGSHNSDTEGDLVAIRQNFIRILERNKVDMIMCGHSHDYERSKLMNGHYGSESTFNAATHNLSSSSGAYDGSTNSCPYTKDSTVNKIGTVYVLSGSAGQLGGQQTSFPHDAMHYSDATNGGSFVLDIEDNKLEAKWLCADGVIRDKFTIFKDVKSTKAYTVQPAQTKTLTASWPGTYTWGNATTLRTLTVAALSDTTIWVKDANTCIADTFKLKVLPSVSFSAAVPYCAATPVQFSDLSTNNTSSWAWSVTPSTNTGISSATAKNPTITFTNAGTYTVSLIATNANGAGTVFSKTITVTGTPTVLATSGATVVCVSQSVSLNAGGATTYSWNTGATTASISVTPTITSVYTVTGTDANGCKMTNTQTIAVNALPVVTVTANPANATVCQGNTLTLSGAGATSYTWSGTVVDGTAFTPTGTATYTVTGTDANGCQNTATTSITLNILPVLTVTATPLNATICNGSTLSLMASGATTFTWSNSQVNGTAFTPTSNATYTVTGTDANGCKNTLTQTVTVNALPTVTTTGNASICIGQTATLTAGGANTYSWSTGTANAGITVAPVATSVYSVTGTSTNNCVSTVSKTITVNALPVITAVSSSTSAAVCSGSTLNLTGAGASTYSWTGGITNGTSFTVSANTAYTVTGTDANGCTGSAVKVISVNALPVITISGNATVCAGQTATLTANGAVSYNWSNGNTGATLIIAPQAGYNYMVAGTDANGCKNYAGTNFQVNSLPSVGALTSNEMICTGQSATLTASGANNYSWNTNATVPAIVITPTASTSYTVTGNDANGCSNKATVTQSVSECTSLKTNANTGDNITVFPNPNSGVFNISLNMTGDFSIEIFNTIGENVYSGKLTTGMNNMTLNAKNGVYFYTIMDNKKIVNSGKLIIN